MKSLLKLFILFNIGFQYITDYYRTIHICINNYSVTFYYHIYAYSYQLLFSVSLIFTFIYENVCVCTFLFYQLCGKCVKLSHIISFSCVPQLFLNLLAAFEPFMYAKSYVCCFSLYFVYLLVLLFFEY